MSLNLFYYPPTPNNTKLQVAMAVKGIAHNLQPVDLRDPSARETMVKASGQPLTPAIVHNGAKLCDSAAILRYLDLNFDGPRLYSENKDTFREIDGWEQYNRINIGSLMGTVFGQLFAEQTDAEVLAELNKSAHAASEKVEQALAKSGTTKWLVGDALTAADIVIGCTLGLFCLTEEVAAQQPLWQKALGILDLGPDRELTRAHAQRVMAMLPQVSTAAL